MSQSQGPAWRSRKALAIALSLLILVAWVVYTNYKKTSAVAPHNVMIAIRQGDAKAVEVWLTASPSIDWIYDKSDPEIKDATGFGETFLTQAADVPTSPKPEIVRLLLAHGADVNKKNTRGESPLPLAQKHLADETGWAKERREIVEILKQAGAQQ